MKVVLIGLAVGALVSGLKAALEWHRASVVPVDLGYKDPGAPETFTRFGIPILRSSEIDDPEISHTNEILAIWNAVQVASQINKRAAIWTACSVALSAMSSVLGALN